VPLQEFADLDLWVGTIRERCQSSLEFLVLMVLHLDESVVTRCRRALRLRPKIDIVQSTVRFAASDLISELAFASLRVVIVENVQISVPRCA